MSKKFLAATIMLGLLLACTANAPTSPPAVTEKPILPCFSPGDPERNVAIVNPHDGMKVQSGSPMIFVTEINGACGDCWLIVRAWHPGQGSHIIYDGPCGGFVWPACEHSCVGLTFEATATDKLGVIGTDRVSLGWIRPPTPVRPPVNWD